MNTKDYLPLIESTLASIFEGKEPYNLYEPIRYVLSIGGKRLRPTFALMSCDLFGGNVNDAVYPACALEVYHNFTLLHVTAGDGFLNGTDDDVADIGISSPGPAKHTDAHKFFCTGVVSNF